MWKLQGQYRTQKIDYKEESATKKSEKNSDTVEMYILYIWTTLLTNAKLESEWARQETTDTQIRWLCWDQKAALFNVVSTLELTLRQSKKSCSKILSEDIFLYGFFDLVFIIEKIFV